MDRRLLAGFVGLLGLATLAPPVAAVPFSFSTGDPDGLMATAARPENPTAGKFEIETGDDFILTDPTKINHLTFTGLLTGTSPTVDQILLEVYRVFPVDSDVTRTSGPPTFSTPNVPTRVNSPSDVAFQERDSSVTGDLTFSITLNGAFTAQNSVQPGGIHPIPNQTTKGDGPVSGVEVLFDVTLTNPFLLPADHYFFVPQVDVTGGEFLWLSAPKPIVPPGTPFVGDLQSWTRDDPGINPDWLRIGTDIVGPPATGGAAPTFNAAFSLDGATVPEASSLLLVGSTVAGWLSISAWKGRSRR